MSVGLIALLDDVAALAKVAAASLDDIAGQASQAGVKAAGVVIDDAAVTPRYVTGFAAERELPIIWRIAKGSLKNKLIVLLPACLLLSYFLPAAITPLLMIGGAYLCYEGTEKIYEHLFPHEAHHHEAQLGSIALEPQSLEDEKIASAIKTDFILSAEIMAIALAAVPGRDITTQALSLALVAVGITVAVYGVVALIVKADDLGVHLARSRKGFPIGPLSRGVGRALVLGMPVFLKLLGTIGTAAMIWVGGGIIIHGLAGYGFGGIEHLLHDAGETARGLAPAAGGFLSWLVSAIGSGLFGLAVGALLIPVSTIAIAPAWRFLKRRLALARRPAVAP